MNIPITLKNLLEPIFRQISMENPQGYRLEAPHQAEYINRASIYFPSSSKADSNIPAPVQYLLRQANEVQPGPVAFKIEKNELPCDARDFCIDAPPRYGRYLMAECEENSEEGAVYHYLSELCWILRQGRIHRWNGAGCPPTAGETLGKFLAGEDQTVDRALSHWEKGLLPLSTVAEMLSKPGGGPSDPRLILRLVIAINGMVQAEPSITLPDLKAAMRRIADIIERQEKPVHGGTNCLKLQKQEIESRSPAAYG